MDENALEEKETNTNKCLSMYYEELLSRTHRQIIIFSSIIKKLTSIWV